MHDMLILTIITLNRELVVSEYVHEVPIEFQGQCFPVYIYPVSQ